VIYVTFEIFVDSRRPLTVVLRDGCLSQYRAGPARQGKRRGCSRFQFI